MPTMTAETFVHPLAVVEDGAQLGAGVRVGPFCHVGAKVTIGDGSELFSHVAITGETSIGPGARIYPQACLGFPPQSHRHKSGPTRLTIGSGAVIREAVTVHSGSDDGAGETRIGDNLYLMAYAHVAHDCVVGNNVTITNNTSLAGHVELGDNVMLGGHCGVHQFVRIGHHAFVAAGSGVFGDVIPYGMAFGREARLRGFNVVGIKRSGMSKSELMTMRRAYRSLFSAGMPMAEAAENVRRDFADSPAVVDICDFILSRGKRFFIVPRPGEEDAEAEDNDR